MKKIVGILSAAAVLAGSVFAADVSANAKIASSLFNYKDEVKVLDTLKNDATAGHKALFVLSVSNDNAGGTVKYWGGEAEGSLDFHAYSVWFKPADILKLSFRENGRDPFADKYHGWNANGLPAVGAGYGVELTPTDELSIAINLADAPFVKGDEVGEFGAKIAYTADFGGIAVIADFADVKASKMSFGAGYSGTFGDVGVVFNAGVALENSKATIKANPSAGGSVDALSWAVDVPFKYENDKAAVGLNAKVGYKTEPAKFTVYFEDGDFLAGGDFAATIGLDIEGNVGAASWKIGPSFKTADKEFNVAFETGISF